MTDSVLTDRLEGGGPSLCVRAHHAPDPIGAFAVSHGIGEHSGRLARIERTLVAAGFSFFAADLRGHGRSDGAPTPEGRELRVHVERFDDLADDLERLLGWAREHVGSLPLFLMGHSMGGLAAARLAALRRPAIAGLVTSSAAFLLPRLVAAECAVLEPVVNVSGGRFELGGALIDLVLDFSSRDALSRDPAVFEDFRADPLVHRLPSARLLVELWRAGRELLSMEPEVDCPVLALHGEADPVTAPEGSRRWIELAPNPDSTLCLYPDYRHELHNELEAERPLADLVTWARARL